VDHLTVGIALEGHPLNLIERGGPGREIEEGKLQSLLGGAHNGNREEKVQRGAGVYVHSWEWERKMEESP